MKNILTFILLLISFGLVAQTGSREGGVGKPASGVKGTISDGETAAVVEYATVSIYSLPDSTFRTGTISDANGKFRIQIEPGNYYAKLEFIAYEDKWIDDIEVRSGSFTNLGQLNMNVSVNELESVVVQADRTQMELTLDKKIFNIGKDLSNLVGSASEILDNLPSVEVDLEGNVSLRGSQNVQILIDGKPSGLVGLSSADALRQIPSDIIESVEVITNPSARYDAEGMAGVINIKLKKDRSKGFNGSFQANTGFPMNHGGSFNINYRSKAINWFANMGVRYRESPGGGNSYQEFFLEDTTFTTFRNNDRVRGGLSYNTRFGADFYINEKNVITTSFLYRFSDENNNSDLTYEDYDQLDRLVSNILRVQNELEDDENLEYSINYTRNFDRKDQKLTFDIQYQDNNEVEDATINETGISGESGLPLSPLLQENINDEGETRLLVQSDYTMPVGEKGKIEAGFRLNDRHVRNDYIVREENDEGGFDVLTNFTNDFRYDESIFATYGIYANELSRLSYQVGVRYERTEIDTELKQTDERNSQLYNNLFPSVNLTFKVNEFNALQGSYSKRISRPSFWSLNPFSSFADARNIRTGNPNLQPEFTDSYEFGLLQNFNTSTLYYAVYYRYTEGVVQRISTVDEFGITFSAPQNLSRSNAVGFEFNANHEVTDWFSVNGNFNAFYSEIIAPPSEPDLNAQAFSFTTRVSNRLKFSPRSSAQINFWYRAPQETTQGRRLSIYSLDIGYSLDVLNNNGTISFNVRDAFNTRKYRGETFGPTFYSESEFQWRARQFGVAFTYRLNQKKQRTRGDRGGGRDFEGDGF